MVLSTHHFRSHVSRRAGRVLRVIWIPDACDAKISGPQISLIVKDEVFGLDVSMQRAVMMEVLERQDNAGYEEFLDEVETILVCS